MSEYDLIVAGVLAGMAFAFGVGAFCILVVAGIRALTSKPADEPVDEVSMADVIALADREGNKHFDPPSDIAIRTNLLLDGRAIRSRQRDSDGAA